MQLVGMVLALLYSVVLAAVVTYGIGALRSETVDVARAIMIVFGSVIILGFLVLPLVFGADDSIDPRRFSLFGLSARSLTLGLAVAGAVSVPALAVTAFAIAQVVTWNRGPLPVLLAILAAVIIIATCVLASRVSTVVASLFIVSRRARDAAGVALLIVVALAAPLIALLATIDWQSRGLPIARRVASALTWTPLGAIWSVPADAADGHIETAMPKLAIALAFVAVLWLAWRLLVAKLLVTPTSHAGRVGYTGLGWFERLPATPMWVVAARSLTYWSRDSRYRVALAVVPVVPIIMILTLIIAGVPASTIAWVPVPVMCLFIGWAVHNDVAHDNSAFWLHVSSNISGRDDRLGRLAPALFLGLPLALVGGTLSGLIVGAPEIIPAVIGLSVCVLLVALGVSSLISAGFPYAAVHPGDSPFAQPQAAGSAGSVVQTLSFIGIIVATAPVIALAIIGSMSAPFWYWIALAVGLGIGLVVLYFGVLAGARIVSRRAPELLAFTVQN